MLTEIAIRKMIPDILSHFDGMATKKEICDFIKNNYVLDAEEDLSKSNSRNESKYVQRVGNIISHAKKKGLDFIQFNEGFELAKIVDGENRTQWMFVLPKGNSWEIDLFKEYIGIELKNKPKKKRKAQKINWEEVNELRMEVGDAGEEYVYKLEREFVSKHFPDKIENVIWSSKVEGDGLGYDVKSVCHDNPEKTLLIEVKSTTSNVNTVFDMSRNELNFFKTHNNENEILELHRLYNRDKNTFKIKKYSQKDVLENFDPVPVMFAMKSK